MDNQLVDQANYWKNPGDVTNVGKPVNGGVIEGIRQTDFGLQDTDRFVSDASYARLKELKISYTFQPALLSKLKLSAATVFVQGLNLITWTKFDGIDPEVVSQRSFNGGGQGGSFAFPLGRQFGGGINISF